MKMLIQILYYTSNLTQEKIEHVSFSLKINDLFKNTGEKAISILGIAKQGKEFTKPTYTFE